MANPLASDNVGLLIYKVLHPLKAYDLIS